MKYELSSYNGAAAGVVGMLEMKGQDIIKRVYGLNGKSPTLTTCQGGHRQPKIFIKTDKKANCPMYLVENGKTKIKGDLIKTSEEDGLYFVRKLTVAECKKLQTVPDFYKFPVSDTQAYKMLGNGWTVEVISHLLKNIQKG